MNPHRLVKAPSISNTCIFCSTLLRARADPSQLSSTFVGSKRIQRYLHGTRPSSNNGAATAQAEHQETQGVKNEPPVWRSNNRSNAEDGPADQEHSIRVFETPQKDQTSKNNLFERRIRGEDIESKNGHRDGAISIRRVDESGGEQGKGRIDRWSMSRQKARHYHGRQQHPVSQPTMRSLPDFIKQTDQAGSMGNEANSFGWGTSSTETQPLRYRDSLGRDQSPRYPSHPHSSQLNPAQPNTAAFSEGNVAGWKHLRFRTPLQSPAQSRSSEPAAYDQAASPTGDRDWIDRSFEEHRRQRDAQQRPGPPIGQGQRLEGRGPRDWTANKRCARCGEMGHIAAQCTGRRLVRCHSCGQIGHLSSDCPRNNGFRKTASADTQRDSTPVSTEQKDSVPLREEIADQRFARSRFSSRSDRFDQGDHMQSGERARAKDYGRRGPRRSSSKSNDEDEDEAGAAREEYRMRKEARRAQRALEKQMPSKEDKSIRLPQFVTVQNLSQMLGVRYEQFIRRLGRLGYDDIFPGKILNSEISGMIAMEYDFEPVFEVDSQAEADRDLVAQPEVEDKEFLQTRPSVVTIMGHVDHGKTTILDYLRKSSVAAGEAGGITQHIGAFSVPLSSSGKTITFLDTPGHEAFLAMRQRGANVTDIVILVVAADDSVKPQTLEALKHAQAAGVPIIVAINKIDKEEADVQRCKQDLARHGVEIEDFGGETQVVCVSGKTGRGMDELEETVVALSEILDRRADTGGNVEGWVIEATTKSSGRVATVLVRRGTVRQGCILVAGKTWARVKTLKNEGGQILHEVGPGMPVEVDGWKDQPLAGDEVLQAPNEQKAGDVVDYRIEKAERLKAAEDTEAINEVRRLENEKKEREAREAASTESQSVAAEVNTASSRSNESPTAGQIKVPFIIKADVSGSAEAVSAYVLGVSSPLITPTILYSGVGAVHESDVERAAAASGHIIAFNLPSDHERAAVANAHGVRVLENNIIYRVLGDVKAVLEQQLPPIVTHKVLGEAEVSATFQIGVQGRKQMLIAGCKVRNGVVAKNKKVRVWRDGDKIYDGTIKSLKNVKKDVQEMRKGSECGMSFENWEEFQVGDQVQMYDEIVEKRKL